jgi:transcriptional regulator with XRE-family HTH domain
MTQAAEQSHLPSRAAYYWGPGGDGPGCRCKGCTEANSAYKKWRELLIETGRWAALVPAEPVREHIRRMDRAGMCRDQLARRAGVSVGGLQKIMLGQRGKPSRNVKSATAAAIFAVEPEPGVPPARVIVDGLGTRRRLEALTAMRWTGKLLAAQIGVNENTIKQIMHGGAVSLSTERTVEAAYGRLWDKRPAEQTSYERVNGDRAEARARESGWAPPAAWAPGELDRPDGKPDPGWERTRTRFRVADLVADAKFIMATQACSAKQAAARLGVTDARLSRAFARMGERQQCDEGAEAPEPDVVALEPSDSELRALEMAELEAG